MLTVKQFRVISLVTLVVAFGLAVVSLSLTRFSTLSLTGTPFGNVQLGVGGFHTCLEINVLGVVTFCGTIDRDCVADFSTVGKLPSGDPSSFPDWYSEACNKFNLFRGMHVAGTLLLSFAAIVGSICLCINPATSPKWASGLDITYCVLVVGAPVFYVVSLITFDQTSSPLPAAYSGYYLTAANDKGLSFGMEAAAAAFALGALIVWLLGRCMGRKTATTGPEAMLLSGGSSPSSGSYEPPAAPGQPQQFFNYGAPAPQPNYQQYGQYGAAPNTNYGFGYQPPPPQQ